MSNPSEASHLVDDNADNYVDGQVSAELAAQVLTASKSKGLNDALDDLAGTTHNKLMRVAHVDGTSGK